MLSSSEEVSIILVIILCVCPMAEVQIAMPMYPMMQPFQSPFGFAPPPMPMPMPVMLPPIAVPAVQPPETITQKPKPKTAVNKPPCPPCFCYPCIPSFFSYCSPCHLKCRCKDPDSVPEPLPVSSTEAPQPIPVAIPLPPPGFGMMPPPVVVIPVPPLPPVQIKDRYKKFKHSLRAYSSSEEETRENYKNNRFVNSWDTNENENKKKLKKFRRMFYEDDKDEELIKPFLSFVSSDGDIRFKTKLSNIEAAKLLSDRQPQEDSGTPNQDLYLKNDNKKHNNVQVFRRKGKTAKVIVTV